MQTKIKFKQLFKAIWFQIKLKGSFRNIFITHNAFGIFSINSHTNRHNNVGKDKQVYKTKDSAIKSAEWMSNKYGSKFSAYKCAYCTGYHIGKDQI
jgi:hypothetical protein